MDAAPGAIRILSVTSGIFWIARFISYWLIFISDCGEPNSGLLISPKQYWGLNKLDWCMERHSSKSPCSIKFPRSRPDGNLP